MIQFTGEFVRSVPEKIKNGVRFVEREGTEKLVVSFSAFTPFGLKQKYNYIKDINNNNALISFLDTNRPEDDPRGTYYLDIEDCDLFSYINTIGEIINAMADRNNIKKDDIYLIGSSKGAVGAILSAFHLGFDNLIINAPQYRIGSYIKRRSTIIFDFMLSRYNLDSLDNTVGDLIQQTKKPPANIVITCGIDDIYHIKEIYLYEKMFLSKKVHYTKILFGGSHNGESIINYRNVLHKEINGHRNHNNPKSQ